MDSAMQSPSSTFTKKDASTFLNQLGPPPPPRVLGAKSFVDEMREISYESRKRKAFSSQFVNESEYVITMKEKDYKIFFKELIKGPSKEKIEKRARDGYTTATIYQYAIGDYFYFDDRGKIVMIDKFMHTEYHLYKTHTAITSEYMIGLIRDYFQDKLGMFFDVSTNKSMQMTYVEVFWGDPSKERFISQKWKKIIYDRHHQK